MIQKKIGKQAFVSFFILVILVITSLYSGLCVPYIHKASSCILYPILLVNKNIIDPIKLWRQNKQSVQELQIKLAASEKKQELLLAENIRLQAILSYVEDIKELREFKKRYEYQDACIAQILVRHFSEQSHYYLVDAGSNKGIKPDMAVVYNDCLVGRVTEVYPWYSKVFLITDTLCKVGAYCAATKAQGIHEGINEEKMTCLSYVSHLNSVKKGDTVISSGEGLIFPQGFGLGKVVECNVDNLYYHIKIEPLIDVRSLRYCMILTKSNQ